jgi:O-antigen ligase
MVIFLAPAASTLTIWTTGPLADLCYACSVFLLAAGALCKRPEVYFGWPSALFAVLGSWGFFQLAVGATVYRHATLLVSLRYAALAATALAAGVLLASAAARQRLLGALVWFGALVALVSVAAYATSPGRVLWWFASPYPDVWGPFLSRNNFAQFLELALPVALYFRFSARTERSRWGYGAAAAALLAAGFLSASRTGATVLLGETLLAGWLAGRGAMGWLRWRPLMLSGAVALVILAAAGPALLGRLQEADPWKVRREIYQAAAQMVESRPWQGYGLGTFGYVYPAHARFDAGRAIEHAHSDWIEWACEGGLGFALLWLVLLLRSGVLGVRTIWGLGVPGVFLHAVTDDPFARLGVAAWAFLLAGALEAAAAADKR